MSGGRPRKPTALKVLHGTDRADRRNGNEPAPPDGTAKPPAWLKAEGRRLWRQLAPTTAAMGCLTVADAHAFALLCDAYAEYLAARRTVERDGATYVTVSETGTTFIRQRPEVAIAANAWQRVQRMMGEFGMTPSSRGRVQVPQPKRDANPFEEWQRGSRGTG